MQRLCPLKIQKRPREKFSKPSTVIWHDFPNFAISHRFNLKADWLTLLASLNALQTNSNWEFYQHGSMEKCLANHSR